MKTPVSSTPSHDALSSTRHFSDQLLSSAASAMDNTRTLANDTLSRAEGQVRSLRGSIDPVVDRLATQAQKLARQSLDIASEASDRAQRQVHRYADATTRYVANEPVKSVLIAAAVGAVVALLVATARQRYNR